MKTLTEELWMEVPERRAIVSIHEEVERLVIASGVADGLVLVKATHIRQRALNPRSTGPEAHK